MDDNMQMPQETSPMSQIPAMKQGMNKMVVALIVVVVVAAAIVGWWWMLRSPAPSPASYPAAESDQDLNELNSINADQNLDAEFQQVDKDLNSL